MKSNIFKIEDNVKDKKRITTITGYERFCTKGYCYMKSYRTFFRWLACILLAAWSTGALKLYGEIPNADRLGDELYDVIQYLFFGGNAIGWIVLILSLIHI